MERIRTKNKHRPAGFPRLLGAAMLSASLLLGCRHATVKLAPPLPASCDSPSSVRLGICDREKAELLSRIKNRKESDVVTKVYHQKFYAWGYYPRKITVQLASVCPDGIREIHQYATLMDGLYTELTLGIYVPRTLKVTCY